MTALARVFGHATRPGLRNGHGAALPLRPAGRTPHARRQSVERADPPHNRRESGRSYRPHVATLTLDVHEEIPEAVFQLLDVREGPHAPRVKNPRGMRPSSARYGATLYVCEAPPPDLWRAGLNAQAGGLYFERGRPSPFFTLIYLSNSQSECSMSRISSGRMCLPSTPGSCDSRRSFCISCTASPVIGRV